MSPRTILIINKSVSLAYLHKSDFMDALDWLGSSLVLNSATVKINKIVLNLMREEHHVGR